MNASVIKLVGAYLLGAGIGAGIGFLIGDYLNAHIDDQEDQFVPDTSEPQEPAGSQTGPVNYESESEIPAELNGEKPVVMDEKARKSKKDSKKEEPTDYTKFAPGQDKEPIEEVAKKYLPVPPAEVIAERESSSRMADPEVISLETFAEGKTRNHCLDWTYYADDDTMADENEDIVPNPQDFLGDDFRENFGVKSDDVDTVYIRNYRNGTDYEVIRLRKKYSVTIAGEPETDTKKSTRGSAKKNGSGHRVVSETPSERRARARKEKVEDDEHDTED